MGRDYTLPPVLTAAILVAICTVPRQLDKQLKSPIKKML